MKKLLSVLLALTMLVGVIPTFVASAATEISSVSVEIMAPRAGRSPSYEARVNTTGVLLDVEDDTYQEYDENGVIWFCGDNPMHPSETFEIGKFYTVRIGLCVESDAYEFRTNLAVECVINGGAGYRQYGTYSYVAVEYTFPVIEGYTVSFNAGDGSGTMEPVKAAGDYTVPECTFTPPSGKVFQYWVKGSDIWYPGETLPVYDSVVLSAKWKSPSSKQAISEIVATSEDIDTIPCLYGRIITPKFTITKGAPAYLNYHTGNMHWMKKIDGKWEFCYDNRFTAGEWRLWSSVRVDGESAKQYELGNPTTLTVNGKQWTPENGTGKPYIYDTYSLLSVYSPSYVIEDDPGMSMPVPIETVALSLTGYNIGSAVGDAKVVTDAKVDAKLLGFLEVVDHNNDGQPDDAVIASGNFSASKTYACSIELKAKNGYDISALSSMGVSLSQALLPQMERYDEETDSFRCIYILKPPAGQKVSISTQPKTGYAKYGKTAKVTIKAKGDGLKYTWYYKNSGAKKYAKSSIKTATYSAKITSKSKNRRVYCVVKDQYGNSVQSKSVLLRQSVSISSQPKTVAVKKNAKAKVTVKARGDGLKYRWYIKDSGAKKYTKTKVTKSYYSVKMTKKVKNRLVYCVVTDKYGKKVTSEKARLKMK